MIGLFDLNQRQLFRCSGVLICLSVLLFRESPAVRACTTESLVGWAAVDALGQNGVTGGAGGTTVTVTTLAELEDYAWRNEPYIIQVQGTITGRNETPVKSNKTIIGLGADATLLGGLVLREQQNIIIRNLNLRDGEDDGIKMLVGAHHIWIDHCDLTNFKDGCLDIARGCEYITVSWCRFHDHSKTCLIGHNDEFISDIGHLTVTLHHNWFDHTSQRHPRVRFSKLTHVYNNFFDNNGLYGVVSTCEANLLVEGNYFAGVKEPFWSASGYQKSPPGNLAERENIFENCGSRREIRGEVPEAGQFYHYTLEPAERIPKIVRAGAGTGKLGPPYATTDGDRTKLAHSAATRNNYVDNQTSTKE